MPLFQSEKKRNGNFNYMPILNDLKGIVTLISKFGQFIRLNRRDFGWLEMGGGKAKQFSYCLPLLVPAFSQFFICERFYPNQRSSSDESTRDTDKMHFWSRQTDRQTAWTDRRMGAKKERRTNAPDRQTDRQLYNV